MTREKAINLLESIFNELEGKINGLKLNTYRDGGSIAFSVPTEGYDNIVLIAPVKHILNAEKTKVIETLINKVEILRAGCTTFEDSYDQDNILETVSLEDRPMFGGQYFDIDEARTKILSTIINYFRENGTDK